MTYQDVDLSVQDVLGLLEGVVGRTSGSSLDLVEARGEVCGAVGSVGPDRVEVGEGGVLSLRKRDMLRAGALNDGERNQVGRHY